MERHERCPLCDAPAPAASHRVGIDGATIEWDCCLSCGLTFQNPPLTPAELRLLYRDYFQTAYPNHAQSERARMAQSEKRLDLIERFKPGCRLMDIGSASGFFGSAAKVRGYQVTCIEPDKTMAEYGRNSYGLDMRCTTWEAAEIEPSSFDVVTLWGTDSHFAHPLDGFQKIASALKPGGLLAMNYQAFDHWIRRLFPGIKVSWNVIYAFTDRSFNTMLERVGMELLYRRNTEWQHATLAHVLRAMKIPTSTAMDRVPLFVPALSFRVTVARRR